ncbi:hypothetical protein PPNSA23_34660 [Phyllobacterium phragmitis]|uniref:Major facilitator superfamily (MFS) profile domain-containing protein n=2 Tax=Phyllobacterium phragmitis TaxID=2670329 RepID=A0ABQ0H3M3_9HYPH
MAFGSVERTSHPKTAFAILAAVQSILIFTIALIMIPLPTIAEEFALSPAEVLLLQVAYGLPFSGLLIFGGRLTDRNGARPMFVAGLTIFGVASIVAALTTSYGILITMRFLQGMGGAIIAPAALGLVRALFPDMAAFSRAMAVWGGVSVLGAVLGFISSGIIASFVSWRWMFVVPIAVAALGLLASTVLLPGGMSVDNSNGEMVPLPLSSPATNARKGRSSSLGTIAFAFLPDRFDRISVSVLRYPVRLLQVRGQCMDLTGGGYGA